MTQTVSVWLVVLFGLLAANLPFVSNRLFAVLALKTPKNLAVRLAELVVWYFVVGGVGLYLEQRAGQIAPQAGSSTPLPARSSSLLHFPALPGATCSSTGTEGCVCLR